MGDISFFPDDLEITNQKIILRLDLNVPIKDKIIKDDTRITSCLPFINRLIEKKFQKNFKEISDKTNFKIKDIKSNKNAKKVK